ncbi:cell division protein FtsA [Cytophagaceae bacterium ABcell3]|nr:cell division protein FtsA [Cytophagaceae bacterium ABcell3]
MQKDKIVAGLDIGTTKICAIVGRLNEFGKLEILGMGKAVSEGVVQGVVTNINSTVAAIKTAIKEAEEQSGIDIRVVNVGIAGQHIRSSIHHGSITRNSSEDEITLDDIKRLTNDMYRTVMPFGHEIIHVMPQIYTVDYQEGIKDPVGMIGIRLEADFHVITAMANAIYNINKCVYRAGLEIENLILEPLASSIAVLSEEEKEEGIVLVDIGGGTTDVAVFYDGIIRHTAVIPFGGNIITSDIKQGLMVMQKQAERLKVRFGRALSDKADPREVISIPGFKNRPPKEISVLNLSNIVQARMEEIIDLVHSEIICSGYENRLAGGIVITGGGSQLQNVKQLFEYMTGMDTRIGYPNEHLGKSRFEEVKSPMYATSVGLVLSGFKAVDERENKYLEMKDILDPTPKNDKKEGSQGESFFQNVIKKTKDFLIKDVDDTDY